MPFFSQKTAKNQKMAFFSKILYFFVHMMLVFLIMPLQFITVTKTQAIRWYILYLAFMVDENALFWPPKWQNFKMLLFFLSKLRNLHFCPSSGVCARIHIHNNDENSSNEKLSCTLFSLYGKNKVHSSSRNG